MACIIMFYRFFFHHFLKIDIPILLLIISQNQQGPDEEK